MAKQQKLTVKQKSDRILAAQERERKAQAQQKHTDKMKKVFTIIVCIILVLALGIPTVALAFLGGK